MGTTQRLTCYEDAAELLRARGQPVETVVAVDRDSILWVDKQNKAWTAWLRAVMVKDDKGKETVRVQMRQAVGFTAEPPDDWPL